jgi:PncC family amidohydrolase
MRPVPNEPDAPLEVVVGKLLSAQKQTLAIAESCTGGLITHRLTNVAGSSAYLVAGVIAYAYEAKVAALGVTWDTLNRYGAVSEETARAMARGARVKFSSTLGLAVTGIAGPGGGTPEKPVGLTYIALADANGEIVAHHVWKGDRVQNKSYSAEAALALLEKYLRDRG